MPIKPRTIVSASDFESTSARNKASAQAMDPSLSSSKSSQSKEKEPLKRLNFSERATRNLPPQSRAGFRRFANTGFLFIRPAAGFWFAGKGRGSIFSFPWLEARKAG